MSTATLIEPRIASVNVTDEAIIARLADGRIVSVPLEWSWRLKDATPEQRGHWEIIGDGQGVHWPDVDEDISIEGMMRGVPARRPSRKEMRILFDASSLIDAEHGEPVSFGELDKMLREHHARLVVTYTSISEFAKKTDGGLALRGQLEQLEHLPIGYLREGGIGRAELQEAIQAFNENRECVSIDPYVRRWDETLVPEGPSPVEMLVNQSLYDVVAMALSTGDAFGRAIAKWQGPLREQFEADRKLPAYLRRATEQRFREALRKHLDFYRISFPRDREIEIAGWVYADPIGRCPGYRLAWEWRQELMNNLKEKVEKNDIADRAHVLAVPYVDAITMDGNTAAHCVNVARRLKEQNPAINYDERIFSSLKGLLDAKF